MAHPFTTFFEAVCIKKIIVEDRNFILAKRGKIPLQLMYETGKN
jgi:hypothetical protein